MRIDRPMNTIYRLRAVLMMAMRSRPVYASELPKLLKEKSDGDYTISLACILHEFARLVDEGICEIESSTQRKKYYSLTPHGIIQLEYLLKYAHDLPESHPTALEAEDIRKFYTVKWLIMKLLSKQDEEFCGADMVACLNLPKKGVKELIYERRSIYKSANILFDDGYITTKDVDSQDGTRIYYQFTPEGKALAQLCHFFEKELMHSL